MSIMPFNQKASNDGHTQLLLCLHGTIPITYRSIPYNIPVAFWIPKEYPKSSPIPYVKPTANMLIREGRHVDISGMCYHHYRSSWPNDQVNFNCIKRTIEREREKKICIENRFIRIIHFLNLLLFYNKFLLRNPQYIPNLQILPPIQDHHKFKNLFWTEFHLNKDSLCQ